MAKVDSESRGYLVTGEVNVEDWSLALQILGRLGLDATAVDLSKEDTDASANEELKKLPPGTVPYLLSEINSREQYIGNEHLGEFWPEYREAVKSRGKTPSKGDSMRWGINMLAHPQPKGRTAPRYTPEQRAVYAERLGLKIIRPRSLVGFSDQYAGNAYGLWDHKEYGDCVIEVGSFINTVRALRGVAADQRPIFVDKPELDFFNALADKLETQISATE